jgi:hypothetical protein
MINVNLMIIVVYVIVKINVKVMNINAFVIKKIINVSHYYIVVNVIK